MRAVGGKRFVGSSAFTRVGAVFSSETQDFASLRTAGGWLLGETSGDLGQKETGGGERGFAAARARGFHVNVACATGNMRYFWNWNVLPPASPPALPMEPQVVPVTTPSWLPRAACVWARSPAHEP
jgi:hypothetical protein